MNEKFATGQVVQLKSGGCKMVVRMYDPEGTTVCCNWHANDGTPQSVYYQPDQLTAVQ
jgi:uncharacterized protein YodC (DUF2158 family)